MIAAIGNERELATVRGKTNFVEIATRFQELRGLGADAGRDGPDFAFVQIDNAIAGWRDRKGMAFGQFMWNAALEFDPTDRLLDPCCQMSGIGSGLIVVLEVSAADEYECVFASDEGEIGDFLPVVLISCPSSWV
jgi:hypothetical protein